MSNSPTDVLTAARQYETGDPALINLLGALVDEVERLAVDAANERAEREQIASLLSIAQDRNAEHCAEVQRLERENAELHERLQRAHGYWPCPEESPSDVRVLHAAECDMTKIPGRQVCTCGALTRRPEHPDPCSDPDCYICQ